MRKKYQVPEFEVKALAGADIVTASTELTSDAKKQDATWDWNPWVKEDNVQ